MVNAAVIWTCDPDPVGVSGDRGSAEWRDWGTDGLQEGRNTATWLRDIPERRLWPVTGTCPVAVIGQRIPKSQVMRAIRQNPMALLPCWVFACGY